MIVKGLTWAALLAVVLVGNPGRAAGNPESMITTDFEFVSAGQRLSGVLDQPTNGDAQALVIFVHGYGPTDVRGWRAFHDLRTRFAAIGIASLVWDKPGRGRSEGVFDIDQPVGSSTQEVVDAIRELRAREVPGARRLGLWSISRGGWIAPLAMVQEPGIEFWISISGVDDQETFRYMLESNLRIEGRNEQQVEALSAEWIRGFEIVSGGGSFADYLAATERLRHDPFMLRFTGSPDPDEAAFAAQQERFATGGAQVDPETGLMIYVPGFGEILGGLDADVLALFGERDTNVDWRKARALYARTIGRNPRASLTIKTFPDGNHNLHRSGTGGLQEMEEMDSRVASDGYYETQIEWLLTHVVARE